MITVFQSAAIPKLLCNDFIYTETLTNSFLRCDAAADEQIIEMANHIKCTDCANYCTTNLKTTYKYKTWGNTGEIVPRAYGKKIYY